MVRRKSFRGKNTDRSRTAGNAFVDRAIRVEKLIKLTNVLSSPRARVILTLASRPALAARVARRTVITVGA